MKMKLNNIFMGHICQVTDITQKSVFHPYLDTRTTHHLKLIKVSVLYKIGNDIYKNLFIDLTNKQKYPSNIHSSNIGDLVVDPRELIPISIICDKLNIKLPNVEKISERKFVKIISKNKSKN